MRNVLKVTSSTPPTVEIDSSAAAAYVRFKVGSKVAKTVECGSCMTADLDGSGEVIGVEMFGLNAVTVNIIVEKMRPIQSPNVDWQNARFVATGSVDSPESGYQPA